MDLPLLDSELSTPALESPLPIMHRHCGNLQRSQSSKPQFDFLGVGSVGVRFIGEGCSDCQNGQLQRR
jgi:hypothetical protein